MSTNGDTPHEAGPETPRDRLTLIDERIAALFAEQVRQNAAHVETLALLRMIAPKIARLDTENEKLYSTLLRVASLVGEPTHDGRPGTGLHALVYRQNVRQTEAEHDAQAMRAAWDRAQSVLDGNMAAVTAAVDELREIVGVPPNERGEGAKGLRGDVARLLADLSARRATTVLSAAGGAGGVVAVVEIALEILRRLG